MKTRLSLAYVLLACFLFTCDNNEDPFPDLNKYLVRFQEEAKKRGYDLDLSKVQAVYVDAINKQGQTYCGWGYSNYDGQGLRRIEISKACGWASLNDTERENLMFHEIGHAFLVVPHDISKRCDGSPLSMMIGDGFDNFHVYRADETDKRDYYISQLLDKTIALNECILYSKNFTTDPIFYSNVSHDGEWIFYSAKNKYTGLQTESLKISAADNTATENGYWYKQFLSPNIPECSEVTLRMTLNSTNLSGKGVGIAVRVYESILQREGAVTNQYQFLTTEDKPISGTLNDVTQELTIPCFNRKTTYLLIFGAMLAGTSGEVTFKNIQVIVHPK